MVGSAGESPGPALNVLFFVPALGALGIVAHGVYDARFVFGRLVNAHNGAFDRSGNSVSVRPWVPPHEG